MKKFLMFSAALAFAVTASAAAAAPSGDPITINSSNTLGIQRTAKGQNSTVVAVPFQAVGGGDVSLKDTLYTDNLSLADTVAAMRNANGGYYTQWIWLPGLMDDLYWTQRRNGEAEVLPGDQKLPIGAGLAVELGNSSIPVYTLGEYSEESKSISLLSRTYTLLSNSSSTKEIDLNVVFNVVSEQDRIYIKDGNSETSWRYSAVGDGDGHHWYVPFVKREIVNGAIVETTEERYQVGGKFLTVAPGVGFRYYRGARSNLTFNW